MAEAEEKTTTPSSSSKESYNLFSFSDKSNTGFGFDLFRSPNKKPPPPPCAEILLSEESSTKVSTAEPVVINDSLTLYKGRVSTSDVFGVRDSDLVPGKYEGGLKLWEGSIDLVKILYSEIKGGNLSISGKHVLELGCGHGLPGIFTGLEGAALVHFQDFNGEVVKHLTIPNVKQNLMKNKKDELNCNFRFFSGDWTEIHKLLLRGNNGREKEMDGDRVVSNGEDSYDGYDLILMAETVYDVSSLHNLYTLIKKCLRNPSGVVYMAGKKYYFGVGGGTRQFVRLLEQDGEMEARLIGEVTDGSSNVREVWKLTYK